MAREPQLVRSSQREVQAPVPSISPNAFGAGVGQALRNVGNELRTSALLGDDQLTADARLAKAQADREMARTRSDAHVRLIRLRSEFGRAQTERARAMDPALPEFTNITQEAAATASREFLSTLPKDLRDEFDPLLASFAESAVTSAFTTEIQAQDSAFLTEFAELTELGVSELLSTSGDVDTQAEQTLGELERVLEASPLSQTAKDAQFRSLEIAVRSAQYAKLAREEALGNITVPSGVEVQRRSNGAYHSARPVAGGLPAVGVGLLNAIAGPESAGEYNRLYSGEGARYFNPESGGWKHPNSGATITSGPNAGQKSTAAGRYQFINGTWKMVSERYGLDDFSPENQDHGAWNWAQDYYASRTNGGNLEAVLRSGDPAMVERVRQVLAEQWEGLKGVKADAFLASVTSETGNPSALINDPLFENIPYTSRLEMLAGAGAEADKMRREMQAEYDAQTAATRQALELALAQGQAGPMQIDQFMQERGGTVDDRDKLMTLWEENNEREAATLAVLEKARDPSALWDNDTQTQNQLDLTYEKLGVAEEMSQGNVGFFERAVLPVVQASQIIPDGLKNTLVRNIYSQDANVAAANFDALAMLAAEAPTAFMGNFDSDLEAQVAAYNSMRGTMPPKDLIEMLRGSNNPATNALRAANAKAVDKLISDNLGDWTPGEIARKIGLGKNAALDTAASNQFQAEALTLFRRQYEITGSESRAWDGVEEIMGKRWGSATVNNQNRVMKYAPAMVHPAFENSHDWINQQFVEDVGVEGAFFITDAVSEADLAEGRPISYRVLSYDSNGFERFVTQGETAGFSAVRSGMGTAADSIAQETVRFTPQITQEMRDAQIARVQVREGSYADLLAAEQELLDLDPDVPEEKARIDELQEQLRPDPTEVVTDALVGFGQDVIGIAGDVVKQVSRTLDGPQEVSDFERQAWPRADTLHRLLGDEALFPFSDLVTPELGAQEKRRAVEEILRLFDSRPDNPELRQLRTDFNIFAREQF